MDHVIIIELHFDYILYQSRVNCLNRINSRLHLTNLSNQVNMQLRYLYIPVFIFLFLACEGEGNNTKKLGDVTLKVTGNELAQGHFKEGLLLLHSFEYLDARAAFINAQQADPSCGMAYWGELMAYNHPLFNRELIQTARAALARMNSVPNAREKLFKTELERDLYDSVNHLYGPGNKVQRDEAYRIHYSKISNNYPNNHEIQAFYALSLISSPKSLKSDKLYNEAVTINQKILAENPSHPGALHYLIHTFDSPKMAQHGLDAANKYAKVAPDAAHALHMPSHIFLALGRWNDVVNSNIESWNASVVNKQKEPRKEMGYHSLSWLHYGLLQRSENELATKVMNDMMTYASMDKSTLARSYMVAMKGLHMEALASWEGAVADIEIKIDDLHLTKRSGYNYLEGMKAFKKNDQKKLEAIITSIGQDKYIASLNAGDATVQMCNTAGNPLIPPNKMDISIVSIMEYELKAKLYELQEKKDLQLEVLKKGAELFESLDLTFGPPVIFKPVHEAYAEALIENNQFQRALEAIESGLLKSPGKLQLLKLKQTVLTKLENSSLLKKVDEEIAKISSSQSRIAIKRF